MTVIAYRDGVMAADSGSFSGGRVHGFCKKLARADDGTLYGIVGSAAEAARFLSWVDSGREGDAPVPRISNAAENESAFYVLVARPGADPEMLTGFGVEPYFDAPYIAIGGASEAALGALHAGATARAAVLAAIEHSQWAHGPVRTISHES